MSFIRSPIDVAVSSSVNIPLEGVAHDPQSYLAVTSRISIFKKYLHKYLRLWLGGQISLERTSVPRNARILWIYLGKRNFGDANMDISGRALLKNLGYHIDLFTHPNLRELFAEDDIFGHVYSNVEDIKNNAYDFVLLSEFNHPSIRFKTKHFRKLPFACLFRFFYGPARNQTCFSYAAINRLFDLKITAAGIAEIAKPYLHHHAATAQSVSHLIPGQPYLTISIGGRDADRSYRHWPEFLRLLDEKAAGGIPNTIVLLGSDNGLEMEKDISPEQLQESGHSVPGRKTEPAAIEGVGLPCCCIHRLRRRIDACGAFHRHPQRHLIQASGTPSPLAHKKLLFAPDTKLRRRQRHRARTNPARAVDHLKEALNQSSFVIPAKAGIQPFQSTGHRPSPV